MNYTNVDFIKFGNYNGSMFPFLDTMLIDELEGMDE